MTDNVQVTVARYGRRFNTTRMEVHDIRREAKVRELDAGGGEYWAEVHRSDVPTPIGVFVDGGMGVVRVKFCRPEGDLDHELIYARCDNDPSRMRLKTVTIWRGGMHRGDRADSWVANFDDGKGWRQINDDYGGYRAEPVDGLDPHAFDEDWPKVGEYAAITRPGRPLWSFGEPPFEQVVAESGSVLLSPDQAA
ncbi:hypothetical protein [Nitriliruptor alkaliphilus]|uniref:hypothetical protein n=1 Tax=Nitriliruptor alkaliphilus TaxID=427918 RepID=UPI00069674A5|nr:hypothetical protein [Nitriliruptor alkaliphilus]